MHVKKQHSKPTQNTKTKRENGPKQKPDKDQMSETDEIQKCLMELSEDEDDGVEIKAEQNLKKVTKDKERKALPDEQNSTQSTKDIEINPMDANALPDNLNSKQIMMNVDKLFNASETVSKSNVDKDKYISLRSKKGTVEQLLTQLRESKYFRSQKNQVFFECPFKEADTFVHLDLIPGWRSKVSKVWKRSFLEFDWNCVLKIKKEDYHLQVKTSNGELRSLTSFLSPDFIVVRFVYLLNCYYTVVTFATFHCGQVRQFIMHYQSILSISQYISISRSGIGVLEYLRIQVRIQIRFQWKFQNFDSGHQADGACEGCGKAEDKGDELSKLHWTLPLSVLTNLYLVRTLWTRKCLSNWK